MKPNYNTMLNRSKAFVKAHPFTSLMLIALIVRIIVVIFWPGYGSNHDLQQKSLVMAFLEWTKRAIGISGSQFDMLVSRLFYALISLFSISMVYRISDLLAGKRVAWLLALLPIFCCVMPSFGMVANVGAFLGLPLLLYGSNVIIRQEVLRKAQFNANIHRSSFFIAGLCIGFGVCIWYESILFVFGILLILCLIKDAKGALTAFVGAFCSVAVVWVIAMLANVNPWNYFAL